MGEQSSEDFDGERVAAPNVFMESSAEVNRSFYRAAPHTYLRQRVFSVMAFASRPTEMEKLAQEGFTIGGLAMRWEEDQDDEGLSQLLGERARASYLAIESEVLLHHVAETLTRLYRAHAELRPCPAWEMARRTSPGDFKRWLVTRFRKDDVEARLREVSSVFFGTANPAKLLPKLEADVGRHADPENIESFLRDFAEVLLRRANLYNAAKHGLGITSGFASMQLNDGSLLKREGEALAFLERAHRSTAWQLTTTWVDPDFSLGLAHVGCSLVEQLWSVARARYLGESGIHLSFFDRPRHEEVVRSAYGAGAHVLGMSVPVALPEAP